MFKKYIDLKPNLEFEINVELTYDGRRNVYRNYKNKIFKLSEINSLLARINRKSNDYYHDKEIWNSLCKVERGKVTVSVRKKIYERDGYKCKCCGRTDDEVYLEIDHILPISKGGKSQYNNLQTLCEECNSKKGSKFIEY